MLMVLLFGYPLSPEMVDPRFPMLVQGVGGLLLSVLVTALSMVIGAGIGTILALCRRERPGAVRRGRVARLLARALRGTAKGIVIGVRGLPIMLLVLLVFYLPYPLARLRLPSVVLATACFSLYAGVYLCEIIRAGLRSVDPQLHDVGRVLGLKGHQILLRIELPLVWRAMQPDLINVAITVFKDTSALAVVAFPELTYTARQLLMAEPLNYGLVLLVVLALYWLPATLLSALVLRRTTDCPRA
ncbi:MAG: ABC transporter permease subunit [Chloroflexales bacterium]|nr:ABC transporter permease subunit [Chloroflexales bacterium]